MMERVGPPARPDDSWCTFKFHDYEPHLFRRIRQLAGIGNAEYCASLRKVCLLCLCRGCIVTSTEHMPLLWLPRCRGVVAPGSLLRRPLREGCLIVVSLRVQTKHEKFNNGGSSGAFLYYSIDNRFIVKTIDRVRAAVTVWLWFWLCATLGCFCGCGCRDYSLLLLEPCARRAPFTCVWCTRLPGTVVDGQGECEVLLEMLPDYLKHVEQYPSSLITRFYGCHSIRMYNSVMHFVVMENIFYTSGAILRAPRCAVLHGGWFGSRRVASCRVVTIAS
jgi:hypothetical protein